MATSSNGLDWQRGHGSIEGARGEAKALDVGRVLEPNEEDWWWLDTRHMAVSDVQVSCLRKIWRTDVRTLVPYS